jgi:hypothetical protein
MLKEPALGSSDGHSLDDSIAVAATRFGRNIESEADLILSLKQGKTEPCLTEYGQGITC